MDAETPILHHYEPSPFSEKVRKVLGYKQLHWASVQVPPIMPKPDLMPLTGGYRKAPVLQLGRDIYCDSKLICRVLDRLQPQRPLIPPGLQATTRMVERWVDQNFFFAAAALFFQPQGMAAFAQQVPPGFMDSFLKDRGAMFAQGGSTPPPKLEVARAELPGILADLDAQLAAQAFLGGAAPAQLDFAVYTPIWFIHGNSGIRAELDAYPRICAWVDRILALDEGKREEIDGAAAVDLCRATAREQPPLAAAPLALPQARIGDQVKIGASDYAPDRVQGELVIANAQELAIRRQDARAGTVVVHFPPEGFTLIKA